MNARLLIVGDEILLGQIADTNSATAARLLAPAGVRIVGIEVVGDDETRIVEAMRRVMDADVVIMSGGLGPTHDDRTRFAVGRFLESDVAMNPQALAEIEAMYARVNRRMSDANRVQAMFPSGSEYLSNHVGTAPGIRFIKNGTTFFCLQGVPREFRWMMETYIVPFVTGGRPRPPVRYKTVRTTGIPESNLYETTKSLVETFSKTLDIAFLPQFTRGVDVRFSLKPGVENVSLENAAAEFEARVLQKYPLGIYGHDDETMEDALAALLFRTHMTIAAAESCTGGLIAHRLTNVSGSSSYFLQGVTAYSNASKISMLGVDPSVIAQHGAVSEATAKAMAEGVRRVAASDIGLSTTGIAGPTGGTPEKPVGLLYIGLATPDGTHAIKAVPMPFEVNRLDFKERASQLALDEVRKYLIRKTTL